MKRKELTLEIFTAGAAVLFPSSFAHGQSYNCQTPGLLSAPNSAYTASSIPGSDLYGGDLFEQGFSEGFGHDYRSGGRAGLVESPNAYGATRSSSRLPAGWPTQWSGPAVASDNSTKRPATLPAPSLNAPNSTAPADSRESAAGTIAGQDSARRSSAGAPVLSKTGIAAVDKKASMIRDPFTGQMVPTAAQPRWDRATNSFDGSKAQVAQSDSSADFKTARSDVSGRAAVESSKTIGPSSLSTESESSTKTGSSSATDPSPRNEQPAKNGSSAIGNRATSGNASRVGTDSSGKPWSVLPSRNGSVGGSGAAIGGGGGTGGMNGGGGSGGGIGGGGNGGGSTGGGSSTWNAQAAGSGGGGGLGGGTDNPSTGVQSYVATDGGPTDGPTDGIVDIPLPDPEIPDSTPDVPSSSDPLHCGGGIIPGVNGNDSPVVPEPGSIILLGIAGGVGGAGWIRRRMKKNKAAQNEPA